MRNYDVDNERAVKMDAKKVTNKNSIDRENHITHSAYWEFTDSPIHNFDSFSELLRPLKRLIEKLFNINISRKSVISNEAFVSFPMDDRILAIRLHLLCSVLVDFFSKLKVDCDESLIRGSILNYDTLFREWGFKNLDGGMGYNNGLIIFCFARCTHATTIIESGIWRGFTTYLLDGATSSDSKLYCFDINLKKVAWRSNKAIYFESDITEAKLEVPNEKILALFDDHVSQLDRLTFATSNNFAYLIFDDDVSHLTVHSDAWPPVPTINMVWNKNNMPDTFRWVSNSRTGIANYSSVVHHDFSELYYYETAPDLFEITGYRSTSRTSYLVRK